MLKGGWFIYTMTDFDSRVTMDVDFLLRKVPNTPEQLKAMLEEIIAVPTGNEFVTYEIKSIAPIAVAKNTLASVHPSRLGSRTQKHRSTLILVWVI